MKRNLELICDNACFYGETAVDAVEDIRNAAYFERGIPLENYIDHLTALINTRPGFDIRVSGETAEEKSESLIKELCRIGVFKQV